MKSDKAFQAKLKETTTESFDVVNTLKFFMVLSISQDSDFTLVEIAPHVPLVLGRGSITIMMLKILLLLLLALYQQQLILEVLFLSVLVHRILIMKNLFSWMEFLLVLLFTLGLELAFWEIEFILDRLATFGAGNLQNILQRFISCRKKQILS